MWINMQRGGREERLGGASSPADVDRRRRAEVSGGTDASPQVGPPLMEGAGD